MIEPLLITCTVCAIISTILIFNGVKGLHAFLLEQRKTHSDIQSGFVEIIDILNTEPKERYKHNPDDLQMISEKMENLSEEDLPQDF